MKREIIPICTLVIHLPLKIQREEKWNDLHIALVRLCRSNMITSSNGNIFRVTVLLSGKFTGDRWIPRKKASDADLCCFLWYVPEPTVEQTIFRYASAPGISYSLPTSLCGLKRAVMSPPRIPRPCGIVSFGIIIGLYLITHEFKAIYSRSLLCKFKGDNFVCYSYHHRIYIKLFHAYLFQPLACSESSMKTVLFKMCLIYGLSCLLRKKV